MKLSDGAVRPLLARKVGSQLERAWGLKEAIWLLFNAAISTGSMAPICADVMASSWGLESDLKSFGNSAAILAAERLAKLAGESEDI